MSVFDTSRDKQRPGSRDRLWPGSKSNFGQQMFAYEGERRRWVSAGALGCSRKGDELALIDQRCWSRTLTYASRDGELRAVETDGDTIRVRLMRFVSQGAAVRAYDLVNGSLLAVITIDDEGEFQVDDSPKQEPLEDPAIREDRALAAQIAQLGAEEAELLTRYDERHPKVQAARQRLAIAIVRQQQRIVLLSTDVETAKIAHRVALVGLRAAQADEREDETLAVLRRRVDLAQAQVRRAARLLQVAKKYENRDDPEPKQPAEPGTGTDRGAANGKTSELNREPLALAMLMHPAELKNGNTVQQAAAAVAINQLSSDDSCGVVRYTPDGVRWLWGDEQGVVKIDERRAELLKAITESQTGDLPEFDPALRMALDALRQTEAAHRHLIVLTDGDPVLSDDELLPAFRDAGITISVVHVELRGPKFAEIPKRMAEVTGGRYYHVLNAKPSVVEKIFSREAARFRADSD